MIQNYSGLHRQRGDSRVSAKRGDCRDPGSDEGYCFDMVQFAHRIELFGVSSFWVENKLGVVEDEKDLLGGKEGGTRSQKLITADESTVHAKPLFNPIVVEDFESNRRLPDPTCANESDGFDVFSEFDYLFDQLVHPEQCLGARGGNSPRGRL